MTGLAIPLGERDGIMLRAYEVEDGLRCGCICPACHRPLVAANQGEKRVPYFRHADSSAARELVCSRVFDPIHFLVCKLQCLGNRRAAWWQCYDADTCSWEGNLVSATF